MNTNTLNGYCIHKSRACNLANSNGYCMVSACTKDNLSIMSKSVEETIEEEYNVQKVVDYLESLGIQIKTEHGYYRNTYDVLKDIGKVMKCEGRVI